ncbi:MAG: flagellar type III secretion system pore protein FliP [Planctomycetota bacterium]
MIVSRGFMAIVSVVLAAAVLVAGGARAQITTLPAPDPVDPRAAGPGSVEPAPPSVDDPLPPTPIGMIEDAASALPGFENGLSGAMNVLVLLTVLTLVPSIMVMTTCFVRFLIVLGLLRQALGTGTMPPAQVITALSLFMTMLVMAPTFERIHQEAILPYERGEITNQLEMWNQAKQPLRDFMFAQIEAADNWSSVYMILNYKGVDTSEPEQLTRADVDTLSLIPAYMLSELKIAFLMGFRVYLPFLIIDMVIASVLISMSMMMLPPVLISLPFKLLMFVLVDGWMLVVGNLMASVSVAGGPGGTGVISNLVGG